MWGAQGPQQADEDEASEEDRSASEDEDEADMSGALIERRGQGFEDESIALFSFCSHPVNGCFYQRSIRSR